MEQKLSFTKRFIGHFNTITKHKLLVGKLCFKMGLYKQGILHDLSKYSPVEFFAGVKYWQGNRSPIDKEKEVLGYSLGWLHHKGHNAHHWEYWIDITGEEITFHEAPKHIVKEMVCDRIAACMVYEKDKYTNSSALTYLNESNAVKVMNQNTAELLRKYLGWVLEYGLDKAFELIKKD